MYLSTSLDVVLLTLWDEHQDASIEGYDVVIGDIGQRTSFDDNTFDFVLTFSVLEHISDLESAFIEISRILKPNGYLASLFGPAWSCSVGHHLYARPGDPLFDFCQWQLPSHIHLLCDMDEIAEFYMVNGASKDECATVRHWFFETDIINRRFFEDYLRLFLQHFYLVGSSVMYSEITPSILSLLRAKYKGYSDFSTYGGSFLLRNMSYNHKLSGSMVEVKWKRSTKILPQELKKGLLCRRSTLAFFPAQSLHFLFRLSSRFIFQV